MPNYPPSPVATPAPTANPAAGLNYNPPQNNPYSPIWNAYNTAVLNPINTNINNQISNLQSQGALQDVGLAQQQQYTNTSLSQGLQGIGLSQQELGVQQGALGRQTGPGGLSQQFENLTQQLFGLSEQDIQSQKQVAQFQAGQSQRGAWSGATSRGATNTSGFGQQLSDIQTSLGFQLSGIDRQEQRLGVAEKQEKLRFGEEQAQLGDQKKILDLQAQRLNLSADELKSRIQNSLNQLGLQRSLNPLQIAQAIDDLQNGRYNALSGVLGQIAQMDPGLLSGAQGQAGGVISKAMSYLGQPYSWGNLDCSGLVQQVYASVGVNLPRTTYDQVHSGVAVNGIQDAQPGDLIFLHPEAAGPGHVGIYLGNGQMIDANHTGGSVGIRQVSDYGSIVAIRRVLGGQEIM